MKKDFEFILEGTKRLCTATLECEPEMYLKVIITVFRDVDIDFKVTIYTNPSFSGFEDLIEKDKETLITDAIEQFKYKGAPENLSSVRGAGLNVIYNWKIDV